VVVAAVAGDQIKQRLVDSHAPFSLAST
jgi:hypothetical protein